MNTPKSEQKWTVSRADWQQERLEIAGVSGPPPTESAEWTIDRISRIKLEHGIMWEFKLLDAIICSLAAERERYDDLQRSVMDLSHPNCKLLLNERNAEREKIKSLIDALKDMRGYDHDRVDSALAKLEKK